MGRASAKTLVRAILPFWLIPFERASGTAPMSLLTLQESSSRPYEANKTDDIESPEG